MLVSTRQLLQQARRDGYAVGAFNVYTLEGVRAATTAAEALQSPVMLQVLPRALALGGTPLIALCREACRTAGVPMAVHLDHCASADIIDNALEAGISSVMADGSHLDLEANITFTGRIAESAHRRGYAVEAGLQAAESYFNGPGEKELVDLMETVIRAMQDPIMAKIKLFGSAGRAA